MDNHTATIAGALAPASIVVNVTMIKIHVATAAHSAVIYITIMDISQSTILITIINMLAKMSVPI